MEKEPDLCTGGAAGGGRDWGVLSDPAGKPPGQGGPPGAERMQTDIDLREDGDYTFSSNGYEIHLQVRDGAVAFVDSPCPDHLCEQFGQLSEVYDWAACLPAQAMLSIEPVE